jgi:hypothetical protein
MLEDFVSTWDDPVAERWRKIHHVIDRDRWRCTAPACSSRRNLHAHHVEFRSAGGGDEPVNLTTLCASHHLHGVHGADEGRLIVRGEAPDRLVWTLGGRESGPPVMIFEGERRTYSLKRVPRSAGRSHRRRARGHDAAREDHLAPEDPARAAESIPAGSRRGHSRPGQESHQTESMSESCRNRPYDV